VANAIATMGDYFLDIQDHINPHAINKMIYEFMERILVEYLQTMLAKPTTFRAGFCQKKLEGDIKLFAEFFSTYLIEKRVQKSLLVLKDMAAILSGDPPQLPSLISTLKEHYPDVPPQFLEKVMVKRTDLGKDAVHKAIEASGAFKGAIAGGSSTSSQLRIVEGVAQTPEQEHTLFAKIQLKQKK